MTEPLVSVLIPTYNGERFLRHTLRSATTQTHRELEILVGDDASTDRTPEVLAELAAADPRIRVIRHEQNKGPWGNPAALLAQARGEYVKFLLHDDLLVPECIRTLVRGIESEPGLHLAFSRRCLVDTDGRPVPGHEFPALADRPGVLEGRELGDRMLVSCSNLVGELTSVLVRRADVDPDDLLRADGALLQILGDLAEHLKLLELGGAFYTPRVLSKFRVHPTQNSQNGAFMARGVLDWPLITDWASRRGFLADPALRQRARARVLQVAAARLAELAEGPDAAPVLEAVHLAAAALVEHAAGLPVDAATGLAERAHGPAVGAVVAQDLRASCGRFPVGVAAPSPSHDELAATLRAFHDIRDRGVAGRFLVAATAADADAVTAALATAVEDVPGLDVQLVVTDEPARLVAGPWLAVAAASATWCRDSAVRWRLPEPADRTRCTVGDPSIAVTGRRQ